VSPPPEGADGPTAKTTVTDASAPRRHNARCRLSRTFFRTPLDRNLAVTNPSGRAAPGTQLLGARARRSETCDRWSRVRLALAQRSDVRHAHADTRISGVMPMVKVVWRRPRPNASNQAAELHCASSDRSLPVRAGEIGPVRREIIFEPVHERPAPVEPAPVTPETEPKEPTPTGP
jgi:hypothetical protein